MSWTGFWGSSSLEEKDDASVEAMSRRFYPRAPLELRVQYRTTGSFLISYTSNLSRGGLFIETDQPLPEGTAVTLRFRVPGGEDKANEIETTAVVMWVRRERSPIGEPPGMGMRFDKVDQDWGGLVDRLVGKFSGISVAVVSDVVARRHTLARLVRSVLACRVIEVDVDTVAGGSLTGPHDAAVVDLEAGIEATRAVAYLQGIGTPVVAVTSLERVRNLARDLGAIDSLEASPSLGDMKAAVLRALARPTIERT